MSIKTHILDYLQPHIETAIWYDCDVLFVQPDCVRKLQHPIPITTTKPVAITKEYHVGSFAVKQNVSLRALRQCERQLYLRILAAVWTPHPRCQQILLHSKLCLDDNLMKVSRNILLPIYTLSDELEPTTCAVHLSNGRCHHLQPTRIQTFRSFGLQAFFNIHYYYL
jgi:hypothetical protein